MQAAWLAQQASRPHEPWVSGTNPLPSSSAPMQQAAAEALVHATDNGSPNAWAISATEMDRLNRRHADDQKEIQRLQALEMDPGSKTSLEAEVQRLRQQHEHDQFEIYSLKTEGADARQLEEELRSRGISQLEGALRPPEPRPHTRAPRAPHATRAARRTPPRTARYVRRATLQCRPPTFASPSPAQARSSG